MIKLFVVDSKAATKPWQSISLLVAPFFGQAEKLSATDPDFGRFSDYYHRCSILFCLVDSIEEADWVVCKHDFHWSDYWDFVAAARLAGCHNKKLVVFYNSDDDRPIKLRDAIIFRTSIYGSRRKPNEFGLPAWSLDFARYNGVVPPLSKQKLPKISYCGYGSHNPLWLKQITELLKGKFGCRSHGVLFRQAAINNFKASQLVETDFILRDGFWADGMSKSLARSEYYNNMISSPYHLCVKGGGNFSYRLYEVFSCGRIPVIIDTDLELPLNSAVNYQNFCLVVDWRQVNRLDQLLWNFHQSHQEQSFIDLQQKIRRTYEQYLSPAAFLSQALKLKSYDNN